MKALVRITASTFEVGDLVSIQSDSHIFGGKDIKLGEREEISIPDLTADELALIYMPDKRLDTISAIGQIPLFRHSQFKAENLKVHKKRKYKLDASNKPELK